MSKILIINGPNINLLHKRNKSVYGESSLKMIESDCLNMAAELGIEVSFRQTNSEGGMVEEIQEAIDIYDGIIINAAGYTHTSVAVRDALEIFEGIKIELHISNIFKREDFRHNSLLSGVCDAIISGLGTQGYIVALYAIKNLIEQKQ